MLFSNEDDRDLFQLGRNTDILLHHCQQYSVNRELYREDVVPGLYLFLPLKNLLDIFKDPKSITGYP